jgi:RNA polymerase sigma-70 factor (ECF subfamily)
MTDPTSPIDSLGELMRAAQQGDGASYLELLRAITPRIRGIIGRQRGFVGIAEVEDLVQDVLLSVHTVRATYDPARPFVPWLLAIVRNRLVDGARRYARIARREIHVDEEDVTFLAPATNDDIGEPGDAATLHQAVRALPEGQRQAIELLKLKGLSLREAAKVSGASVGALKVATHRAMATLRRTLVKRPE